jgi:hypothetical protein
VSEHFADATPRSTLLGIEGGVAVAAGIIAGSVALVGFGLGDRRRHTHGADALWALSLTLRQESGGWTRWQECSSQRSVCVPAGRMALQRVRLRRVRTGSHSRIARQARS